MEEHEFARLQAWRHEKGSALGTFLGVVESKVACERRAMSLRMRQPLTQNSPCRVFPAVCWVSVPGVGARRETQTYMHTARPFVCAPNPFTQTWAESFQIKLWKELTPGGLLTKWQSSSLPAFHPLMGSAGTSPHAEGQWQGRFPSSAYTAS